MEVVGSPGQVLADIEGRTQQGVRRLSDLRKPGRYMLVWWTPEALTAASCRTCSSSKGPTEPIRLMTEIYDAGCDIVGVTCLSPDRAHGYLQTIGLIYPMLSVTPDDARKHGVAKVEGEPWPSQPHRVAFLVSDQGDVINRYQVHDPVHFLRLVRDDVQAGPPTSKWEEPVKTPWYKFW